MHLNKDLNHFYQLVVMDFRYHKYRQKNLTIDLSRLDCKNLDKLFKFTFLSNKSNSSKYI